jgi:hypothetical protein
MSVGESEVDLGVAKPVGQVLGDALRCYRAYPGLFAALTLTVVVPFAVLVWLIDDASLIAPRSNDARAALAILVLSSLIVQPLISALHVNALVEIGAGKAPILSEVFRKGARALPVVAAAEVMSALGIGLGFIALIIPGVLLLARWAVVAQAAAIERVSWLDALRRSAELTRSNYLHVLGVVISVGLITTIIDQAFVAVIGSGASAVQIVVGIAVQTVLLSFAALTSAMLYYDLRARTSPAQP